MAESTTIQSITSDLRDNFDESYGPWLVLAGIVLFIFPEPITSFVGVPVLAVGLVVWLFEKLL